jgi:hypothetical protein
LSKDPSANENWAAVESAVRERMLNRKMSTAQLARETRLSETTIRYLSGGGNKSTLVAISAVLGWHYNHLINILHGEPEKNARVPANSQDPAVPLPDTRIENLLRTDSSVREELRSVREEVADLRAIVHAIDGKIDALIAAQPIETRAIESPAIGTRHPGGKGPGR